MLVSTTANGRNGSVSRGNGLQKRSAAVEHLHDAAKLMFAFTIFLNLHHYFIDNAIWRGDNELLRKHLVQASQRRAEA